jgi:membrane associated rhomboid family serine protease
MKRNFYENGYLNWLYVLFAANVVGFLIAYFAFMFSDGESALFFAIHSGDKWSLIKIWKLFTYAFANHNIIALIGNLIWLWVFGEALGNVIGSKQIFRLYLIVTIVIGIIAGVFCLFPSVKYPVYVLGFDMVTIALAAACVYKIPHHTINFMLVGSIPFWIIGVIFLLYKVFAFPDKAMALNLILCLFSAIIGLVYIVVINQNRTFVKTNVTRNLISSLFKKRINQKVNWFLLLAIKGSLLSKVIRGLYPLLGM